MLRPLVLLGWLAGLGCVPWARLDADSRDAGADLGAPIDVATSDAPSIDVATSDAPSIDAPTTDLATDAVDPVDAGQCGAIGQSCCATDGETPCLDAQLVCVGGTCQPCGAPDQPCCAGARCVGTNLLCNPSARCALAPCPAGSADCDSVAANGCEAQTTTDPDHCGGCGNACAADTRCVNGSCVCPVGQSTCGGACRDLDTDNAHCGACNNACTAGRLCSNGECATSCATGTTACDGACRDLANDPRHCMACGRACSSANGAAGCRMGACFLAACDVGYGDCDGAAANGCETVVATDAGNCGACGNRCQFANAAATCAAGRCLMGACAAGFRDCNGNPADGCETNTASGDTTNCGGCGVRCPAAPVGTTAVCSDGRCGTSAVSCPADRRDCNASAADGCEAMVLTDVNHCGACGARCSSAGGTPGCAGGVCSIACGAGLGNCDGLVANGCETSTQTSTANCGACNRPCSLPNAVAGCAAGQCTVTRCNEGFGDCDGVAANGCERNLRSDAGSCGACGVTCPSGRVCSAGVCRVSCGTPAVCSDACRDTRVDPDHCGGCGMACSSAGLATRTCNAGACAGTCVAGRANCNADLRTDGCETDTNTTATACGGCGLACSGSHVTPVCAGGRCVGACAAGYADCDGDRRNNGCETSLSTGSNCGGCGVRCLLNLTCLPSGGTFRCLL